MTKPVFMSEEHVAQMNERLAVHAPSLKLCRELPRDYQISYELKDGDKVTWWTMSFTTAVGARFKLSPPDGDADIAFSGSYWAMMDFMRKLKAGDAAAHEMPLVSSGDMASFSIFGTAFSAAQDAAMMDTEIPRKS